MLIIKDRIFTDVNTGSHLGGGEAKKSKAQQKTVKNSSFTASLTAEVAVGPPIFCRKIRRRAFLAWFWQT
ncbi:MAG: hypothetical protein U7126_00060 [Microcoleus sp.]